MTKLLISSKGYLIQKRAFKNNGFILTLFTDKGELLNGIMYQGQKKNLALFQPYFIEVYVREGLSLISKIEPFDALTELKGESLFCALYINELIGRLAKGLQEAAEVYLAYQQAVIDLSKTKSCGYEFILRDFEFSLLAALGYHLDIEFDVHSCPILSDKRYFFNAGEGLTLMNEAPNDHDNRYINGAELHYLKTHDLADPKALKVAKWLNRQTINFLLDGKELVSRQLFRSQS